MLPNVREGITDETQETIYLRVLSVILNQLVFSEKNIRNCLSQLLTQSFEYDRKPKPNPLQRRGTYLRFCGHYLKL